MIANRDFLGRVVWKKEGEVYVVKPETSALRPTREREGVVRGEYPSAVLGFDEERQGDDD